MTKDITATDSHNIITAVDKNIKIIDCRTPLEYEMGHIKGAINLNFYSSDFQEKINKLNKGEKYLIYCQTGNRSGVAMDIMKRLEFKEVYNMLGGIEEWKRQGFSVVN